MSGKVSDGSTADYYELPPGATELQHLIAYKNMNAQMGEIFRANYRYGEVSHSDKLREINKILFYAQAEKERLLKYELPRLSEPKREAKEVHREDEKGPGAGAGGVSEYLGPQTAEEREATARRRESAYAARAAEEAVRKQKLVDSDTPNFDKYRDVPTTIASGVYHNVKDGDI